MVIRLADFLFLCCPTRSNAVARVVLPTAEVDTDEEGPEEGEEEETDDGDFLADFPDDTEVRSSITSWRPYHEPFASRQELELVHARIGSLNGLRLARFAEHLKKLCLRQNFISQLEPETFHQLTKLEELDLYDNKVKNLGEALDKLESLK